MQHVMRRFGRTDPPCPVRRSPVDGARSSACPRGPAHRASRLGVFGVLGVLGLAVLCVACSGADPQGVGIATTTVVTTVPPELATGANVTVPVTIAVPDGYVAPDTRNVRIAPVIGKPKPDKIDHDKPQLDVEGGTAKMHGTIFGPDGPVEGATVRLERFAGIDFGILDVVTDKDGTYHADDIKGGRYRVRAWLKPDLATVEPIAIFLAADKVDQVVDIDLERHNGLALQGALDAAEPHVGEQVSFKALLTQETTDDNGIVQGVGVPGVEIDMAPADGIRALSPLTGMTGDDGFVIFTVACLTTGDHTISIISGDQHQDVALPPCLEGSLDGLPPDAPELAVGASFTVPAAGPFPAGTYTSTGTGNCGTSYEQFVGDAWARSVSLDKVIVIANPSRSFEAVPGSTPCTFQRTA